MSAKSKRYISLLKDTIFLVSHRFRHFGINKRQEIIRLIYEISKRENIKPEECIKDLPKDFETVKRHLIKRRFPFAYSHEKDIRPYLPKIALSPENEAIIKWKFYPKKIIIEKAVSKSPMVSRFKRYFPDAQYIIVEHIKSFIEKYKTKAIIQYNKRRDTIFIINKKYGLFKNCPCTKDAIRCGYHIFNLSFGCIFECTYCYLQGYVNSPGIIFPANLDVFFKAFDSYKRDGIRIGTGEFSDSLMLDDITEYSLSIVDFFKRYPNIIFEFKTKSDNIKNLLCVSHSGNIVVSWSVNPQHIITTNEFLTTTLQQRLRAARLCIQKGYRVGFHLDPVFYFEGWEKEYGLLIDRLFSEIKPKDIAWISIGTFRFKPELKLIIEQRFPSNTLLDGELLLDYDNKLRYPKSLRYHIYDILSKDILRHSRKISIYLCMENYKLTNF